MSNTLVYKRWIVTGLLASTVVALASPAFADHRRYKGVQSSSPAQRVYVQEGGHHQGPAEGEAVGRHRRSHTASSSSVFKLRRWRASCGQARSQAGPPF